MTKDQLAAQLHASTELLEIARGEINALASELERTRTALRGMLEAETQRTAAHESFNASPLPIETRSTDLLLAAIDEMKRAVLAAREVLP